jgi:hypothetical protein
MDLAPKNILVNKETHKIVAFYDVEWAGPSYLGKDISSMICPLSQSDIDEGTLFSILLLIL